MKQKIIFLALLAFLVTSFGSLAQTTGGSLSVANYNQQLLPSLLNRAAQSGSDTGRVNALIKLSSIYYRKDLPLQGPDSALIFSRQALALSTLLHDQTGFCEAAFLTCKRSIQKNDLDGAETVLQSVTGELRVRLLIVIGEHFVFLPGVQPAELSKAYPFLRQARELSEGIHSSRWKVESLVILGKYYFARGEFEAGKNSFMEIINYYTAGGDKPATAHWWSELGTYMPDNDSTYNSEISSHTNALQLYHELHQPKQEAEVLANIAAVHRAHNRFDLAIKEQLTVISTLQGLGVTKLVYEYQNLAEMYQAKGELRNALVYGLKGLKSNEEQHKPLGWSHKLLGDIYRQSGEAENSLKYYRLSLTGLTNGEHDYYVYIIVRYVCQELIALHQPARALQYVKAFAGKEPPARYSDQEIVAATLADCYDALKQLPAAENYYLKMIRLDSLSQIARSRELSFTSVISGAEAFYAITRFYTNHQRYRSALPYLRKLLTLPPSSIILERDIKSVQSTLDSAAGNYQAALISFKRQAAIKDSLSGLAKDKALAELRIRFETAQKEKDIQLLKKDGVLQKRVIEEGVEARKFTYAGLAMLLVMLGVVVNRYLLKLRKNSQLEVQQKTINDKNTTLEQLLKEKEWLIKEVHHRVKNNLQIVMSLLYIQSEHLDDETAINAILESRQRVQTMSMLHQRLYQTDNSATINMRPYVHELMGHLSETFDPGKNILFKLNVSNIELDLAQAVPIGLILNEIVTNSLKHAFPDVAEGEVEVHLTQGPGQIISLQVADNGIGIPPELNLKTNNTFGLNLIFGLTEDIGGHLTFKNGQGTAFWLQFDKNMIKQREAPKAVSLLA